MLDYFNILSSRLSQTYKSAAQSKSVKQVVKSAKETANKMSQQKEELSQTEAYKTVAKVNITIIINDDCSYVSVGC